MIVKTCTANDYRLGEERPKNLNKDIRDHGFLNIMVLQTFGSKNFYY